MGATNTTANYSLSQFVGTDKPAWLQDYNGDMLKIDTGINAAKIAADNAGLAAGAAQSDATTANNAITNTITPAITSLQTTVGNQGGTINTITSLIGNGTPTTTDQTIIGAINEINAKVGDDVLTTTAQDCTGAINELAANIPSTTVLATVTSDGVKTRLQLLNEIIAAVNDSDLKVGHSVIEETFTDGTSHVFHLDQAAYANGMYYVFTSQSYNGFDKIVLDYGTNNNTAYRYWVVGDNNFNDRNSQVLSSGYATYKVIA